MLAVRRRRSWLAANGIRMNSAPIRLMTWSIVRTGERDGPSDSELTQVVIEMFVVQNAPALSGDAAERAAHRPVGVGTARGAAADQTRQVRHVVVPGGGADREELGRALRLPLRPRHDVDHEPVDPGIVERTRGGIDL